MADHIFNVLFLCTRNSARSILGESILNKDGRGRFKAYSAGSHPKGVVNPLALKVLKSFGYPAEGFSSKKWEAFAEPGSPVMDFVFTVCDDAAGEACPVWPGQPMTAHWGIEDPARIEGNEIMREAAFVQAFKYLKTRIGIFINLPLRSLGSLSLQTRLREIGERNRRDGRIDLASGESELTAAYDLPRRLAAEAAGTGVLVATVVGSGIMAETLTKDVALALLGNTLPTGAILVVLITILGPVSGAHFNPAVSLVFAAGTDASENRRNEAKRRDPFRKHWPTPVRTFTDSSSSGRSNMRCAAMVPVMSPAIWART